MSANTKSKVISHNPCDDCPTNEVGFFCDVNKEITNTINHIKITQHYKAGDRIYAEGDGSEGLYSIRSGVVKLEKNTENGISNILNILGPGCLLGYRSFFSDEKHSTNAIALENVHIYFLPKQAVRKLFKCHHELVHKVIAELSKDSNLAETKWISQINKSAPTRVAEALFFLTENFSQIHWTRKIIADWAGTSTETVIRTLALLQKEGILAKSHASIEVLKPDLLLLRSLV